MKHFVTVVSLVIGSGCNSGPKGSSPKLPRDKRLQPVLGSAPVSPTGR